MSQIARQRDLQKQIGPYARLQGRLSAFAEWRLLPFDQRAVESYRSISAKRPRIGSMDLKIASIALVHGGTLLSRNMRDFQHVPDLRVEDWL